LLDWRVLYTIENLLERRCLKWVRITHLDIWNTSYGQKKGRESNWQFDSRPLKVRNWLDFLTCNIPLESSWRGLQLCFRLRFHRMSARKVTALKVAGVLTLAISRLPLGSPGIKSHLDVGPMGSHKVYYKWEGGDFPQVRAVVSLVSLSCLWFILAAEVFQLCTNHLVLVLCRPVWVSEACQFFLVPSRSSSMPLYPLKMLWTRECALTPYSSIVFCLGFTFESFKELGAHHCFTLFPRF
jgi:hypothetical protein